MKKKQQPGDGECPAPRFPAPAGGGPGQAGGLMKRRPLSLLPFLSLRDYVFCMATLLLFCLGSLFYQLNGGPPHFLLALRHCLGKAAGGGGDLLRLSLTPRGGWAGASLRTGDTAGGRGCRAGGQAGRGAVSADTGAGPAGGAPRRKLVLAKAESPQDFPSAETALRPRAALCVPGGRGRARCAGSSGPSGAQRSGRQRSLPAGRAPGELGRCRPELSAPPRHMCCAPERRSGVPMAHSRRCCFLKKEQTTTDQTKNPRCAL